MAENTTTPMNTLVVDGKSYEIVDASARQNKQDTLISGTNIKTINSQSLLGSGNVEIGGNVNDVTVNGTSVVTNKVAQITTPTKTSDLTNDSNFQNATQVDSAINSRIASVYKAKGSISFANLPALISSNEGFVYDINESFITTNDFVEGAGVTYPAGTNVVIIDIGNGTYKYDVLAGLVDLSGKQDLLVSGTNIKTINNESILGSGNLLIPTGDVNVQSDWNQTDTTADDYIKNKPASMPASDVSAWAKAATKPTYTAIEVGAQETLVSGTNIKTIHNTSLLGSGNITLSASDIGAVPTTRTINSKALSADVTLSASDVGAVPTTRKVNNKALSTDITLSASDVGAQATLVSGTNIKTINNQSVLGSGNLTIDIPTKVSELTNDSNFQNATEVETAINTKISSVYKAKGSVAFANLPALIAANEGFVYNITDDFTTTSDFVEGAGAQYAAGTNVVIIDIGSGVYKYDVLAGMVVSTLALAQKHESSYTTTAASETTIPIGISGFRATDVLTVDINGLDLIEGTDYTISGTNIVLTTPITTIGTVVHFVAMRMAEISTQDYAQLKGDPGTVQIVRW